jgi:DNA-directed RNA polymerase I subunit RPA1
MENSQESKIIQHEISGVRFDMYTPEMTRKISIKKITNPIAFDNLGRPNPDGLYDLALGPSPYDNDSL